MPARIEHLLSWAWRKMEPDIQEGAISTHQTQEGSNFYTYTQGEDHEKVVFLLAGWRTPMQQFLPIASRLAGKGFYTVTHAYDNDVISSDAKRTVKNLESVQDHILGEIDTLKGAGHTSFSIFGSSLGGLVGAMAANKSEDIQKIILNTAGADIAESVWSWEPHEHGGLKQGLMDRGMTLENLRETWKPVSTINNIDNFDGKQTLIYLAKRDKAIPREQGRRLLERLDEQGNEYTLIENKLLGHFSAAVYNLVRSKRYVEFLKG